jgi:hypothetical protein
MAWRLDTGGGSRYARTLVLDELGERVAVGAEGEAGEAQLLALPRPEPLGAAAEDGAAEKDHGYGRRGGERSSHLARPTKLPLDRPRVSSSRAPRWRPGWRLETGESATRFFFSKRGFCSANLQSRPSYWLPRRPKMASAGSVCNNRSESSFVHFEFSKKKFWKNFVHIYVFFWGFI